VSEYLQAGAKAAGVGISLFREQAVLEKNWDSVSKNVERFVDRCSAK
jgi:2-keto-3-deoxy-6-phosphogluconate aldolase